MSKTLLKDKALLYGEDMVLTSSGDFSMVSGYEVVLQAAQNRILSVAGTRKFDDEFGSEIQATLQNMPASKVTDSLVTAYVTYALQPMIFDKRIDNVNKVKIVDRTEDSIFIEVALTLGTFSGTVVVEMKNFIS